MTIRQTGVQYKLIPPDMNWHKYHIDNTTTKINKYIRFIYRHSMLWRYVVTSLQIKFSFDPGFINGKFSDTINDMPNIRLDILKQLNSFSDILKNELSITYDDLDHNFNRKNISELFKQAVEHTKYAFMEWKQRAIHDNFHLIVYISRSASFYCKKIVYILRE